MFRSCSSGNVLVFSIGESIGLFGIKWKPRSGEIELMPRRILSQGGFFFGFFGFFELNGWEQRSRGLEGDGKESPDDL